ncbi:MAG: hypothetical protein WC683_01890 [bacterium]
MQIHLIYHMDADGHASAGIVQEHLRRERPGAELIFHPIDYGMAWDDAVIQQYDRVYLLDFMLQPVARMRAFVEHCRLQEAHLTWIDHHRTSLVAEAEEPLLLGVQGVREEGRAACELTWNWCFHERQLPEVIELVAAWDVFRRDHPAWDRLVRPLQLYLRAIDSDPATNHGFWQQVFCQDGDRAVVQDAHEYGAILMRYQQRVEDDRMQAGAAVGPFAGYRALVVNAPGLNSTPFERDPRSAEVDLFVAWSVVASGQISVSMYRPQGRDVPDLGALAKQLGAAGPYGTGGGHPGAAGFQTDWAHLQRLLHGE